jgi:hypothetical protein
MVIASRRWHLKALEEASISVQAQQSPNCSYFLSHFFEDRRFNHVTMYGLQFGRYHQPATDDARLIGETLAIASLDAEFRPRLLTMCLAPGWGERPGLDGVIATASDLVDRI